MTELQKAFKEKMADFDYRTWVLENLPVMIVPVMDKGDIDHIVGCLHSIVNRLTGVLPSSGGFVSALIKEDYKEALARADHINEVAIKLYLVFIITYIPMELLKKERS